MVNRRRKPASKSIKKAKVLKNRTPDKKKKLGRHPPSKTSSLKKTVGGIKKKRIDSIPSLFLKLRLLQPKLERQNYFELDKSAKQVLSNFEGVKNGVPKIEAWTFTLHPSVVTALRSGEPKLKRFIVTIDALRSKVYEEVKGFLESRKANITSYYTGGWADFLCDIHMDQAGFDAFINELKAILKEGIENILGPDRVEDVISYFEVVDQIILCGRSIKDIQGPGREEIEELLGDRARFELIQRDYRAAEALKLFDGSESRMRGYLNKLKSKGIIICYDIVFDFSFGLARDYVPMILAVEREGPIVKLLDEAKKNESLFKPVREWLKVRPVWTADEAEKEVNYLFINEYDYPGERTRWKQSIYKHTNVDVNLYNYPLESTLNESPIYLSNLPEFLNRARKYQYGTADRVLFLGYANHPLLREPKEAAWPLSGLGQQGVTLGDPGNGKTNMDLVIASEAVKHLKNVVVFDPTGGIDSKRSVLPPDTQAVLKSAMLTGKESDSEILEQLSEDGLVFLTCDQATSAEIFSKIMGAILSVPDPVTSNAPRRVSRLLMVEEAGDLLGDAKGDFSRSNVQQLTQLLTKAWRKGWCVWISTQRPTSLGYDDDSRTKILSLLQNRILSRLQSNVERELVVKAFRDEQYKESELESLAGWDQLSPGSAFCRAMERTERLPLLRVDFRLLSSS